eukprot:s631_g21.t1
MATNSQGAPEVMTGSVTLTRSWGIYGELTARVKRSWLSRHASGFELICGRRLGDRPVSFKFVSEYLRHFGPVCAMAYGMEGDRNQLAAMRLLHAGDVWRLDLTLAKAPIFLCLNEVHGVRVTGLVAYWQPPRENVPADGQGMVVSYKVDGFVQHGKLHLRPAPAVYNDSDELLQETLVMIEPKGWGRHVASVVWSHVAKHTHYVTELVQQSWRPSQPMERQHIGCRSRSDAAKLHQEQVQKLVSKGYQQQVKFDVIVDLLGETPMMGCIVRTDGLPRELSHSAKLVHPDRKPSPEVTDYLSCRSDVLQANRTARATRAQIVKLFDQEQRNQLIESIADYWLNDRKERAIRAKLPPNDQHEAYFATQTLHEWYGDHLFAVASWRNKIDFLRYLEAKDPQIEALQILFGNLHGDKITIENDAAIYKMEEDDPLAFCDQLRGWVTVSASKKMAPFLSHVQVFLPNPALRGVTLIDAAGLGDDNRQRREMAASLVATADFVWVLAKLGMQKISRGLSNQLARKMLRSLSRKVLLDKNSEGEITFILTHSDVLNESEIAKRGGGSRKKLALQRAKEVPFKFAQDMERELWHSDGNQAASALGAYAVSATDYLRIQGFDIYEPLTFDTQEETQVPMVRQQMLMQALKRHCDAVRTPVNQICSVLKKVVAHLSDPGTEEENRRRKCENIVQRHVAMYQEVVTQILSSWEASAMEELHHTLASKIRQGASKGAAAAEATSNEWAVHSNYHHATYKGMVRRGCTWEHPSRGHLDWPEELAEPVYKKFSKNWRDLFGTKLPQQASDVKSRLQQAMQRLHANIQREVVQGGCRQETQVVALQEGLDFSSFISGRLDAMLAHVKRHSADVTGTVQEQVVQSLTKASSQCADSNYARQKQFIKI